VNQIALTRAAWRTLTSSPRPKRSSGSVAARYGPSAFGPQPSTQGRPLLSPLNPAAPVETTAECGAVTRANSTRN